MSADGRGWDASGTAVVYTPEYVYDGANVFFQCASGLTPCSPSGYDFSGTLQIPAGRGGNLYVSAGCGGGAGAVCDEGGSNGAWSLIELSSATLRLTNTATPTGSGVSGPLVGGSARGTEDIAFTAADPGGPGVYSVQVEADGHVLYTGTPDSNGGKCIPVGSSAGALEFDASQPCRTSEAVVEPIDTTSLPDGTHTLKVAVTDAAQNTSTIYDAEITTDNAPANTVPPELTSSETTLIAAPGQWSGPPSSGPITYSERWETCDPEGSGCRAIAGAQGSIYTPSATDAGHALRVLVTAADRDGSTALASEPSAVVPAPAGTGAASGPLSASSIGVGNGLGASDRAQLRLTGPRALSRQFARRAFAITGQLLDASGRPISGATLDIREQLHDGSGEALIGFASTSANGTFSARIPAGPSRRILIAYRAFSGELTYSASTSTLETVSAGVKLSVSPRRTSPAGRVLIDGTVAGPIPREGVVVELLVHYRGRWAPFRDPHSDSRGRFRVRYQFEGAVGRFPFRAEVLGAQAGFPYATGVSRSILVATG